MSGSDATSSSDEIEELFHRAKELAPSERDTFLDAECGGRPAVRAEVASLLDCRNPAASFFDTFEAALFSSPSGRSATTATEAVDRRDPLSGTMIQQYEIRGVLGRGGMGVVYRARDTRLDRSVALKFLAPGLSTDPGARDRFLAEAQAAANLDHPNICNVHEIGETPDGRLFIAMSLYEGESLRERSARGTLSPKEALDVARQVCAGLSRAHERGVVHRDITPGNLFRTEDGTIKILDFGLARMGDRTNSRKRRAVGTLEYMSPEQLRTEAVDRRSDVWSLAVVLYGLLAGETPFHAGAEAAVVARILNDEPPSLRNDHPHVPERVDRAIRRALEKDPADRPSTAAEFFQELTGERLESGGPTVVVRRVRWQWWKRAVVGTLAASAIGSGWLLWSLADRGDAPVFDARLSAPILVLPAPDALEDSGDAARLASALSHELARWSPVRTVSSLAIQDARMSLGMTDGGPASTADAIELAREVGAGTAILVRRVGQDTTAAAEATVVDVASRRRPSDPVRASGHGETELVARLAHDLLRLPGTADLYEEMHAQSGSVLAWAALDVGRRALSALHLRVAERRLREAIAADSTFAVAHHYLAMALYWRGAYEDAFLPDLGGEIAAHTGTAARLAARLPGGIPGLARIRDHVTAFDLLQRDGNADESRRIYRRLLASDSSDAFAWLGLGLVEYRDTGTFVDEGGELRARADWNVAIRAFERARGLAGFHLGYGHWFDIQERMIRQAASPRCETFEPPSSGPLRVWESDRAAGLIGFTARVVSDSIVWVRCAGRPPQGQPAVADSLLEIVVPREITRWISLAPEHPEPYEQRARWRLLRRGLIGAGSARRAAMADSLSGSALEDVKIALGLREDTVPEDLFYIGSVYLAAGYRDRALQSVEAALARRRASARAYSAPPVYAANVLLANGRPTAALEIVKPDWKQTFNFAVPDTVSGRMLESGPIGDLLADAFVDGVTGYASDRSAAAVRLLGDTWTDEYGPAARRLKEIALDEVGPALVLNRRLLHEWFDGWPDVPGDFIPFTERPYSREDLAEYVERLGLSAAGRGRAVVAYLMGMAAQEAGLHELAIRLFEAIESGVFSIDHVDAGWSLKTLATARRAASQRALGNVAEARTAYRSFLAAWPAHEAALEPLMRSVRSELAGLEGDSRGAGPGSR